MNTDVVPFEFDGAELRVLTDAAGQPLFVLTDVCRILALSNPSMVAARLDPDALSTAEVTDGMGRSQTTNVVTEPGLYEAVFMSRKPEAQAFKRWITHEVLPALRRTGTYTTVPTTVPDLSTPGGVVALAEHFLLTARQLEATQVQLEQAEHRIEEDRPLVERARTHAGGTGLCTRQQFARELITWAADEHDVTVRHAEVMTFLHRIGLFIARGRSDSGQATTDAIRRGLAVTVGGTAPNGHNYSTGKLTAAGQAYAWDKAVRLIDETGSLAGPPRLEVLA